MKLRFFLFTLIPFLSIFGQQSTESKAKIEALRIEEEMHVDGQLKEKAWQTASAVHSFTQLKPYPGNPARKKTEVRMVYNDDALYISAICYDDPDSISNVNVVKVEILLLSISSNLMK